jgi:ERCC4-type nuclease
MKLIIDTREDKVMAICNTISNSIVPANLSITIHQKSLPLGDILLTTDDNEELVLFERKSLSDLASSIKDGRYKEQGHRLHESSFHNHNIIYIVEGDFQLVSNSRFIKTPVLYSSIISMIYYKGFSVVRTMNIRETGEFLLRFVTKLQKESQVTKKPLRVPFYKNGSLSHSYTEHYAETHAQTHAPINIPNIPTVNANSSTPKIPIVIKPIHIPTEEQSPVKTTDILEAETYSECVVNKRIKKNNINTHNIGEIMLSQIPGVSVASARAIIDRYNSIPSLITALHSDGIAALHGITIPSGKSKRQISSTSKSNIMKFLLCDKNAVEGITEKTS